MFDIFVLCFNAPRIIDLRYLENNRLEHLPQDIFTTNTELRIL